MGLFDEVNKAAVNQQQVNSYSSIFQNNGVTVKNLKVSDTNGKVTVAGTVSDMNTAEKATALLASQPDVQQVVNLLEIEDLIAKTLR